MMHKYDLITTVAGFLKDRDEAFIVSEEQTDEERSESAAALVTMLTEYPLNWKPERGGKYESALDPVAGLYIISRDGWRNDNGPWHETMTPKAAKEGAHANDRSNLPGRLDNRRI